MILAKTNEPDYVKDLTSGGLLNNNTTAFEAYKQKRRSSIEAKQMQERITTLENNMQSVIHLLEQILDKVN